MILGIGVDLVSISRIARVHQRFGARFARRILSETELDAYLLQARLLRTSQSRTNQDTFLAKRFAVKEAAVKALGTGERQGVLLKDFSVSHDDLGKPLLQVAGQAKILCDKQGINQHHVSLSDEQDQVVAFVILEN